MPAAAPRYQQQQQKVRRIEEKINMTTTCALQGNVVRDLRGLRDFKPLPTLFEIRLLLLIYPAGSKVFPVRIRSNPHTGI